MGGETVCLRGLVVILGVSCGQFWGGEEEAYSAGGGEGAIDVEEADGILNGAFG